MIFNVPGELQLSNGESFWMWTALAYDFEKCFILTIPLPILEPLNQSHMQVLEMNGSSVFANLNNMGTGYLTIENPLVNSYMGKDYQEVMYKLAQQINNQPSDMYSQQPQMTQNDDIDEDDDEEIIALNKQIIKMQSEIDLLNENLDSLTQRLTAMEKPISEKSNNLEQLRKQRADWISYRDTLSIFKGKEKKQIDNERLPAYDHEIEKCNTELNKLQSDCDALELQKEKIDDKEYKIRKEKEELEKNLQDELLKRQVNLMSRDELENEIEKLEDYAKRLSKEICPICNSIYRRENDEYSPLGRYVSTIVNCEYGFYAYGNRHTYGGINNIGTYGNARCPKLNKNFKKWEIMKERLKTLN